MQQFGRKKRRRSWELPYKLDRSYVVCGAKAVGRSVKAGIADKIAGLLQA